MIHVDLFETVFFGTRQCINVGLEKVLDPSNPMKTVQISFFFYYFY